MQNQKGSAFLPLMAYHFVPAAVGSALTSSRPTPSTAQELPVMAQQ
jgi:hypothetical protein